MGNGEWAIIAILIIGGIIGLISYFQAEHDKKEKQRKSLEVGNTKILIDCINLTNTTKTPNVFIERTKLGLETINRIRNQGMRDYDFINYVGRDINDCENQFKDNLKIIESCADIGDLGLYLNDRYIKNLRESLLRDNTIPMSDKIYTLVKKGDLETAQDLLDRHCYSIDKKKLHYIYNDFQDAYYKFRDIPDFLEKAKEICICDYVLFDEELLGNIVEAPCVNRLILIYEKQGNINEAINVCARAVELNLQGNYVNKLMMLTNKIKKQKTIKESKADN